jgi:hypothetical protein
MKSPIPTLLLSALFVMGLAACDEPTQGVRAADAAEQASDAVENSGEALGDAIEEAEDEIDDETDD